MRLFRGYGQAVGYLCQGTLQLSGLTGQIGGVSVRITLSQSSQAEGQQCCYDVDNIGQYCNYYECACVLLLASATSRRAPEQVTRQEVSDEWDSRDECYDDKVAVFDVSWL